MKITLKLGKRKFYVPLKMPEHALLCRLAIRRYFNVASEKIRVKIQTIPQPGAHAIELRWPNHKQHAQWRLLGIDSWKPLNWNASLWINRRYHITPSPRTLYMTVEEKLCVE